MASYLGFKAWDMGFDAHLTVLYLGELSENRENFIRAFIHAQSNDKYMEGMVVRQTIDLFGPNKDTPVVTVMVPKDLYELRERYEHHFGNASEFKDWNPHITLDILSSATIHIPLAIRLSHFGLY